MHWVSADQGRNIPCNGWEIVILDEEMDGAKSPDSAIGGVVLHFSAILNVVPHVWPRPSCFDCPRRAVFPPRPRVRMNAVEGHPVRPIATTIGLTTNVNLPRFDFVVERVVVVGIRLRGGSAEYGHRRESQTNRPHLSMLPPPRRDVSRLAGKS